jgi:hypothetical protein
LCLRRRHNDHGLFQKFNCHWIFDALFALFDYDFIRANIVELFAFVVLQDVFGEIA